MIFSPFEAWEKVTTAQRGFFWVLFTYLLPLLVIALGIEGWLLTRLGEKQGELGFLVKVPVDLALRYTAAYGVLLLVGIAVSAKFLGLASESFNVRASYFQTWLVMAYGFSPIILARILDGIPQINTWVCWAIGVAASASVMYHGVGAVLRPDQTKGFGLYLISIIVILLVSGVIHFVALEVLHGKLLQPRSAQVQQTELFALARSS